MHLTHSGLKKSQTQELIPKAGIGSFMSTSVVNKMQSAGCSPPQIERFLRRRSVFLDGQSGFLPEHSLEAVDDLPRLEEFPPSSEVDWSQLAVVKLNGGLGTSMGLSGPKSLLPVRGEKSFLSILVEQCRHFRLPLVLMNSFATQKATREALKALNFQQELPYEFLQSQVPKLKPDGEPATDSQDPDREWCPPGHGDIYPALVESGVRDRLLEAGIKVLFVANVDNLGAVPDARLLNWFLDSGAPFMMEVTRRTEADKKGGHLARRGDQLILRESAQCPEEDKAAFMDIQRHRYFNTNSLWIRLDQVEASWYDLPLIVNRKTVNPADPESQAVVQLETAMGAAIGKVPGARAVEVPRSRFAPVKTTNDLLVVGSDCYRLTEESLLTSTVKELPVVDLDTRFYKLMSGYQRLVATPPGLRQCRRLTVQGPVVFDRSVSLVGAVELRNPGSEPRPLPSGDQFQGSVEIQE